MHVNTDERGELEDGMESAKLFSSGNVFITGQWADDKSSTPHPHHCFPISS